jgi:hypothetical protein
MGMLPRTPTGFSSVLANFNTCVAQSFTKTNPIRNGAVVTWKPQDNHDLEYKDIPDTNPGDHEFPTIFIATSGMANSASVTSSLRVRVICNYEAIPTTDTFAVLSPTTSASNSVQLEQAWNWASQAYNNMYAFVSSVSPYVQPVLNTASQAATQLGSNYIRNRLTGSPGNSLRIQY